MGSALSALPRGRCSAVSGESSSCSSGVAGRGRGGRHLYLFLGRSVLSIGTFRWWGAFLKDRSDDSTFAVIYSRFQLEERLEQGFKNEDSSSTSLCIGPGLIELIIDAFLALCLCK